MKLKGVKAGAMFGLDARIALAIFGALSVISGAALYSAIEQSRAIQLISDLNELGKAWEAYYLDVGEDLPRLGSTDSSEHIANTTFLSSSAVSGWKGPYTSLSTKTTNASVLTKLDQNDEYVILYVKDEPWGDLANDWYPGHICDAVDPCYAWVHVKGTGQNVAAKMDEIIDNGDGGDNGKLRFRTNNDIYDTRYFLKYAPVFN